MFNYMYNKHLLCTKGLEKDIRLFGFGKQG